MLIIFAKTVIIYFILALTMRILGKRQLGELEVSELITTILISEIASAPITDDEVSLLEAIVPLGTIVACELLVSFILSHFSKLRNFFASPPSTLIYKGKINQKELRKNRISPEELLSALRQKDMSDPSHVEYAILEQNGLLSVIPMSKYQQPTLEALNIDETESGIIHIIISQGAWNEYNLKLLHRDKSYFEDYLARKRISARDVFLLTVDDANNIQLTKKK